MPLLRIPHPSRLALALILLVLTALVAVWLTLRHVEQPQRIRITSIADLQRTFETFDYSLASVRRDGRVPRLMVSDIPGLEEKNLDAAERKKVFFETVLPLVLMANERVGNDRQRLLNLDAGLRRGTPVGAVDRRWLAGLAARYRIKLPVEAEPDDMRKAIDALRRRVAPVPPSLALSQAAVESAYGTSRFSVEGNALFGQWTDAGGLKPERQRADKSGWSVADFASPLRSVEAYLRNLNTHGAYRAFRAARHRAEIGGATPSGLTLAATLEGYSEKGPAYVEILRAIIRTNGLAALDHARLDAGARIRLIVP